MVQLRAQWSQLFPNRPPESSQPEAVARMVQQTAGAGVIQAVFLRSPRMPISPADLPEDNATLVNVGTGERRLLIAGKGGLPVQVAVYQDGAAAVAVLNALRDEDATARQIDQQAGRLFATVEVASIGKALRQKITAGIASGALDAAVVTHAPVAATLASRPEASTPISQMSDAERIGEALRRSTSHLTGEIRNAMLEMIAPENLAIMAGVFLAVALAQLNPVTGAAVDGTLMILAWSAARLTGVLALGQFIDATVKAMRATTEKELEAAGETYAKAIVAMGVILVQVVMAKFLKRGAAKDDIAAKRAEVPKSGKERKTVPLSKEKSPIQDVVTKTASPKRLPHYRQDLDAKWFDPDSGALRWPEHHGFASGTAKPGMLSKGTIIDRFGGPNGNFTSPSGETFSTRALPYDPSKMPYKKYEVLRDLPVTEGKIAPFFDQPGGGTQYVTEKSIQQLLDANPPFLKEIL